MYDSSGKLKKISSAISSVSITLGDDESATYEVGSYLCKFDKNGNLTNYTPSKWPDGIITKDCNNTQNTGDCYLHAALNSILQLKDGEAMLSNLITKYNDGSYEITFPGTTPDGTKSFKFSEDEVLHICCRNDLSDGNKDIALIEAAYEKSLKNVNRTLEGGIEFSVYAAIFPTKDKYDFYYFRNFEVLKNSENPLNTSDYIKKQFPPSNKTLDDLLVEYRSDKEKMKILRVLDDLMFYNDVNPGEFAASCGIEFSEGDSHALSIKQVTDTDVILIDSGRSAEDNLVTIPIETFVKCIGNFFVIKNVNNVDKINHNQIKCFNDIQRKIGNAPNWNMSEF